MQHVIIQDLRPRHAFHAFLKLDHYSEVGQLADVIDLILNLSHLVLLLGPRGACKLGREAQT
mgnify:CR=1 FL=1